MTAVVTRKGVGGIGGVGDTVVIMTRTSLAYVSQPWRVVHCDEPWTSPPEPSTSLFSSTLPLCFSVSLSLSLGRSLSLSLAAWALYCD